MPSDLAISFVTNPDSSLCLDFSFPTSSLTFDFGSTRLCSAIKPEELALLPAIAIAHTI